MVQFDVLTLFPGMFDSPLQESILMRARKKGLININVHDLRDYTDDKHHTADDYPYGGGAGMVMKVEPIVRSIEAFKSTSRTTRTILTTPQGSMFDQEAALRLHGFSQLIIVCGRYEGVDERVLEFVDEEVSIGDYVLSGGELAAMVIIDAVARLEPGVVGDRLSVSGDTFANSLLKYPQFTRPETFRELDVPKVLVSGDHKKINRWRRTQALRKTWLRRPEMLAMTELTDEDREILDHIMKSEKMELKNECN